VNGQSPANKLADIVYDPFVAQEQAENLPVFGVGVLTVHYQAAITDGNDMYMMVKTGSYVSCNPPGAWATMDAACGPNTWNTQIWNEARFTWVNGVLMQIWIWPSDWKPEPTGSAIGSWEPVFHAADANGFIYVPGAGGTIWKLKKTDGSSASHINAFSGVAGVVAANTFVAGPLTADSNGNIYYNVIQLADPSQGDPYGQNDIVNAWLVKVTPGDSPSILTFASLLPNAPPASSQNCPGTFFNLNDNGASLPWPPTVNAVPPPQVCGSQRPGINIAPAVGPDGTIFTASRAHFDSLVSYVVAVEPDFSGPKWAASLQSLLNDGCGVLLLIAAPNVTNEPDSCRNGATQGIDPTTNGPGSGFISDLASWGTPLGMSHQRMREIGL